MKIEKIDDHQIRCTLTKEDLADRDIKISELAYGTEKAKNLFRDMMQQASFQFGFEAEDIPLMIEAIPMNQECIVFVITKVEDPEELDTRFSKFAPSVHDDDEPEDGTILNPLVEAADGVLDLFKRLAESRLQEQAASTDQTPAATTKPNSSEPVRTVPNFTKMYQFRNITDVSRLAQVLSGIFRGRNSLYKNNATDTYQLVIERGDHSAEEYNKICNILSEYGTPATYTRAHEAYLAEHCELILGDQALQTLGGI